MSRRITDDAQCTKKTKKNQSLSISIMKNTVCNLISPHTYKKVYCKQLCFTLRKHGENKRQNYTEL